jgi:hypothetical protein
VSEDLNTKKGATCTRQVFMSRMLLSPSQGHRPGVRNSGRSTDRAVDGLAVGMCGTDKEIAAGEYGWAPPARDRLITGPRIARPGPHGPSPAAGSPLVTSSSAWSAGPTPSRAARAPRAFRHVPQRPVHRTRHQATRRLRERDLGARGRLRRQAGSAAGPRRHVHGTDDLVEFVRGEGSAGAGEPAGLGDAVGRAGAWGDQVVGDGARVDGAGVDGACGWPGFRSWQTGWTRKAAPDLRIRETTVGQSCVQAVESVQVSGLSSASAPPVRT